MRKKPSVAPVNDDQNFIYYQIELAEYSGRLHPMREHQIVVSLKADQFQEVLRLAKASGHKSVGVFMKQKLLAALSLEGAQLPAASKSKEASQPDLKSIANQLRRLHRELQVFVAESLSTNEFVESGSEPKSSTTISDENSSNEASADTGWQYYELPTGPIIESAALIKDEMERLAERAFAVSPRLGVLEPSKPHDTLAGPLPDRSSENIAGRNDQPAPEVATDEQKQFDAGQFFDGNILHPAEDVQRQK
jgi:hypothetical protein